MEKVLNKKQKKEETLRQLKMHLKRILPELEKKLDQAISSGALPEEYYEKDNWLLSMAIMDSYCKDRPFSPFSKETQKEFDNIHKFI